MKHLSIISITLLAGTLACSNADGPAFQGRTQIKTTEKAQDALPEAAPAAEAPAGDALPAPLEKLESPAAASPEVVAIAAEDQVLQKAVELTLEIKLPSAEIREGKKPIQALALLSRAVDSEILWTLEGPAGKNLGSIDAKGLYTSPASVTSKMTVTIAGTLANDQTVFGKKSLDIIQMEQLFVGCMKGNVVFPITSVVYKLAAGTPKLPNFATLTQSDTVCLDKFDIPLQGWEAGFPGAPALQEWFALHSSAKISIPTAGIYSFQTLSDDGSILYIDSKEVVNNDGQHSATVRTGDVTLTAGKHALLLDWYQGPRVHIALQLKWKVPGSTEYVIVPTSAFSAN